MPTRNIVITDHQSSLIDELVASGRYQNASDVLREGLRLVEAREAEQTAKLDALRAAVGIGTAALDRGDYIEFSDESAMATHLDSLASKAKSGRAQ